MPSFVYVARETASGREIRSSVEAATEQAAIAALLNRNMLVVSIQEKIGKRGKTAGGRSEEHTSELQSPCNLVCRLLLEKKKKARDRINSPISYFSVITPCATRELLIQPTAYAASTRIRSRSFYRCCSVHHRLSMCLHIA